MDGSQINEYCSKCQMPLAVGKSGSITQWILICKCNSLDLKQNIDIVVSVCLTCGKRVQGGRSGSLTQWVFRADLCSCKSPETQDAVPANTQPGNYEEEQEKFEGSDSALSVPEDKFPYKRYIPIGILGQGASGTVYEARDKLLKKTVALKTLHYLSAQMLILFQNEARATSKLSHPGIVKVLDFGSTDSGLPYMVLEYVDGISLEEQLQKELPTNEEQVVKTFSLLCEALSYAHSKNIYHRDIKPSNVLIVNQDFGIKLIDFGVAQAKAENQDFTSESGKTIVGTPAYMSPDQGAGLPYDARSEVYSIGCMLYETLTGSQLFQANSPIELLAMHANQLPKKLNEQRGDLEFSEDIQSVVSKCLEKNPSNRYQTVKDLKADLDSILVSSAQEDKGDIPKRFVRGFRYKSISLIVVTILGLTGFLIYKFGPTGSNSSKPKEAESKNSPLLEASKIANTDHKSLYEIGDSLYSIQSDSELNTGIKSKFVKIDDKSKNAYRNTSESILDEDLKELSGLEVGELILEGCSKFTGEGFKYLVDSNVISIQVQWCSLSEEGFENLAKLKSLKYLYFAHSALSSSKIECLSKLKHLKVLQMFECGITDSMVESVSKLKNLDYISLSHNRELTFKCIKPLKKLKRLRTLLAISVPGLNDTKRIKRELPNCRVILYGLGNLHELRPPLILDIRKSRDKL